MAGGEPVKLANDVMSTSFDVVEAGVYFVDHVTGHYRLRFLDPSTRSTVTIADDLGAADAGGLGVSSDGRDIYFTRIDALVNDLMLVDGFR